jgi:hypothetical protein
LLILAVSEWNIWLGCYIAELLWSAHFLVDAFVEILVGAPSAAWEEQTRLGAELLANIGREVTSRARVTRFSIVGIVFTRTSGAVKEVVVIVLIKVRAVSINTHITHTIALILLGSHQTLSVCFRKE